MPTKEQLQQARELIKNKRYDEARRLLKQINHPVAEQWLETLDQMQAQSAPSPAPAPAAAPSPAATQSPPPAPMAPLTADSPAVGSSSSRLSLVGLLVMAFVAIVGGIGLGILLFLSSKLTYLIFVSLIIATLIAGFVMKTGVRVGKVRAGAVAFIFGLLMGLLMYGSYRVAEYIDSISAEYNYFLDEVMDSPAQFGFTASATRQEITDELDVFLESEYGSTSVAGFGYMYDEFLIEETGSGGFVGFVMLQAQEGMSISSMRSLSNTDSGTNIGQELTIGYWVLEILIAGIGVGWMARGQANQPFCDETNKWLKVKHVGTVHYEVMQHFMQLLSAGHFAEAAGLVNQEKTGRVYLTIEAGRCHDAAPDGLVKIIEVSGRNRNEKLKLKLPTQQYNALTQPGLSQ